SGGTRLTENATGAVDVAEFGRDRQIVDDLSFVQHVRDIAADVAAQQTRRLRKIIVEVGRPRALEDDFNIVMAGKATGVRGRSDSAARSAGPAARSALREAVGVQKDQTCAVLQRRLNQAG